MTRLHTKLCVIGFYRVLSSCPREREIVRFVLHLDMIERRRKPAEIVWQDNCFHVARETPPDFSVYPTLGLAKASYLTGEVSDPH